ncbi:hypothetical protein ACBI99_21910 [Nonomuraea sp. ATR24]|uniref:hypothetical protein n=1 Tax=Nonomuraea TaxID=83681 RepID=UPI001C5E3594|nr:hypothetical protein [Nonomuraea ceibae]
MDAARGPRVSHLARVKLIELAHLHLSGTERGRHVVEHLTGGGERELARALICEDDVTGGLKG